MDNVEQMYRHLVRTIRTRFPQYLTQPFDIAELHQNILPYRHHRRELGLETNEDYEIALLELLSGSRGYLVVDDRLREALQSELASPNPDPGAFRQFASAQVSLSPSAVRSLDASPSRSAEAPRSVEPPRASQPEHAPRPSAPTAATTGAPAPRASQGRIPDAGIIPKEGDRCRACDEKLPVGRAITFCPHCGQNLTMVNCPACGTELEIGWRFCPVCGRPSASR
jgi:hypothetical protein